MSESAAPAAVAPPSAPIATGGIVADPTAPAAPITVAGADAAALAPAVAPPVVAPPAVVPASWTEGLTPEQRGYVELKGFQDNGAVLDSYKNLESLNGVPAERILKLPERSDDPAWGDVHNKLGRPVDANGYALETPQGVTDEFALWARNSFHELGFSKSQGEGLMNKWNAHNTEVSTKTREIHDAKIVQEEAGLKREWGAAYDQNIQVAKNAAAQFGLNGEMVDKLEHSLGFTGTVKLLQMVGSKIGEGSFVTGGATGFNGALTPEAAKTRIDQLRGDPDFVKRYTSNQIEAREEMERMHKYAYPEEG